MQRATRTQDNINYEFDAFFLPLQTAHWGSPHIFWQSRCLNLGGIHISGPERSSSD